MSAPPLWYGVLSRHQANRSWWRWMARSCCAKISFWARATLKKKCVLVHDNDTPYTARHTRNILSGCCELGAQWPLKGWRSLYGECLDDWRPWWRPGEVIHEINSEIERPDQLQSSMKIATPVHEIWLNYLRNVPIWYSSKISNFPLAQVSYSFNIKKSTFFSKATFQSFLVVWLHIIWTGDHPEF